MKRLPSRPRGVAVITALLLTTLAVTIVASLFWRQQVQIRSMENQRLQTQNQWVVLSAFDWARRVLRDDARNSNVDHLGEKWAQPLVDARLDDFLGSGAVDESSKASMSTYTTDAQARYNLTNLARDGAIVDGEVVVFQRLLNMLAISPDVAIKIARAVASGQYAANKSASSATINGSNLPATPGEAPNGKENNPNAATATAPAQGSGNAIPNQAIKLPGNSIGVTGQKAGMAPAGASLTRVEDLLSIPGVPTSAVEKLRPFVTVLPDQTPLNANTTSAEVLAAVLGMGLAEVKPLIASRDRSYFQNVGDIANRLTDRNIPPTVDVKSHYFYVATTVQVDRATTHMEALIQRNDNGQTLIRWLREL